MARKVLVVDDEPKHRELLSRRLRAREFEVITAAGGKDALTSVAGNRPDIILMDIKMPGQDGWETTRALKASSETRDIPVIALSALDLPNERTRCADAGCDDFEPKPLALRRLLSKIDRLCPPPAVSDNGAEPPS